MTTSAVVPNKRSSRFIAYAFGLRWSSDCPLIRFSPVRGDEACDVSIDRVSKLQERNGGQRVNNGEVFGDGTRFAFGGVVFDTFGGSRVTWWSPEADALPFAFYGTVTAIILAWRQMVPLHASAVAFKESGLLIAGPAGAGKSTLCKALVDRGGRLVSDDLSVLAPASASPSPILWPGRREIRLAASSSGSHGDKTFHEVPMVDPLRSIELTALVLLRDAEIRSGPAEAAELLRQQLFRPRWMGALPHRAERAATILHTALRIRIIEVPRASSRPDIAVDEKAQMVLKRLSAGDDGRRSTAILA